MVLYVYYSYVQMERILHNIQMNSKEEKMSDKNKLELALLEFKKYYERCNNSDLKKLTADKILLIQDALSSKDFLRFLYCHL